MRITFKGVTRIVFLFKTFVIKIPALHNGWCCFLRGLVGNINEGQTWRWNSGKYEKGKSHLLCPVIWTSWGGWILVMKRAKIYTTVEWDNIDCDVREHTNNFAGDDKVCNYGFYQGKLVKIDYADLDVMWGVDFKPKT